MALAEPATILAFTAVVEHGSYRAAARELGIPKSTLSQRVTVLEEHLGARLLSRTTRSVQLTDLGASYYRDVAPAIDALRNAEATVASLQAKPSGRLRMTTPHELGQRMFGDLLARYAAECPDVSVELVLADRHVNLVEEGFDLAVRMGPLSDSTLVARRLGAPQRHGVFASRAYVKRAGMPKTPRDLEGHHCLVMSSTREPVTWSFTRDRAKHDVRVKPYIAVNSFTVLTRLVEEGLGVARLPSLYAREGAKAAGVRAILGDFEMPLKPCFAVYPSARNISPALRAMVDLLEVTFAGAPWG